MINNFNIVALRFDDFDESMEKLDNLPKEILLALDTETTSLTFWRDGNYILGYSLATSDKEGYYFNARLWTNKQNREFIEKLNSLSNNKTFWNWYFDYGYSKAHYGIGLEASHDGLIWFHSLFTNRSLENVKGKKLRKGFSLKEITSEFTEYGDYESELKETKKKILGFLNKHIINKNVIFREDLYSFMDSSELVYETIEEIENVLILMNKYIEKGKTLKEKDFCYGFFPDNILDIYAIFDVLSTWNLTKRCIKYADKMYKEGWEKIYDIIDIKHKATKLYADASVIGFKVDREYVKKLSEEWKPLREMSLAVIENMPEVKQVERLLFRDALTKAQDKRKSKLPLSRCRQIYNNTVFNLNSSQHKYKLFIDLMNLKPLDFNSPNKKGEKTPKLDNEFVEYYANKGYDFMDKINTYALYQKGISSFLGTDEGSEGGLWNLTSDNHPYNHSNFNITGTISSRLSMSNVNLSQFPSRGVLHDLKNCFVVEEEYKLFTFDFSTSELRILAALADEPNFKEAFENGLDLHSKMAYSIWKDEMDIDDNLPDNEKLKQVKEKYGDTYRYYAKGINFGLPYSISEVGLSKSLGVTKKEAKSYIDRYEEANSKIKQYMDWSKDKVMKEGYTEGSFGERLYLKNAKGYNWRKSKKGRKKNWKAIKEYKKATNFIIQSDNAFMLYYSLVSFFEDIKKQNLDITLISTIYDSIYIRVHKDIDNYIVWDLLKKHFEINFYGIDMKIDIGIALNEDYTYSKRWGHLKDVKYEELEKISKINS